MRENQNGSLPINILSDEEDEGGNAIPKSKQESEVGFNLHFKAVGFSKGFFFFKYFCLKCRFIFLMHRISVFMF